MVFSGLPRLNLSWLQYDNCYITIHHRYHCNCQCQSRPRFPPPLLPRQNHQCTKDQPVSLVTQDSRTTPVPTVHPQSLSITSIQAQFYEKTLEMVDIINDPDCPRAGGHRELQQPEVKKVEESIQRFLAAVRNFTNHFTVADKKRFYSLA